MKIIPCVFRENALNTEAKMMDDFEFKCGSCNKIHKGMPTFAWKYPVAVEKIPREERAKRVKLGSDLCVIDGKTFYIRGCIEIPVIGLEKPFLWGTWVSVSEEDYHRYQELFDAPGQENEPPFFGWLDHTPPGYPEEEFFTTMVFLRPLPQRPSIVLEATDHPLAMEQRHGISIERLIEITETVMHSTSAKRH
jgi:hypothetical protein